MKTIIYKTTRRGLAFAVLVCSALLLSIFSQAQTDNSGSISRSNGNTLYAPNAQASANLDQVRNGSPANPISPATWVNGNVGASNSHFVEGYSIPYRVIMTGMPVGTSVWIELEFDARQGGKHAIDFITHYENLEPHDVYPFHTIPEDIDPTIGTIYYTNPPSTPVTAPIIAPENSILVPFSGFNQPLTEFVTNYQGQDLGELTLWGGTFGATPMVWISEADLTLTASSTKFRINFIPSNTTCILAWGGHIAMQATWDVGNSAVNINGSPYHMRLKDWSLGNLGNQDRSCNADAIANVGPCDFLGEWEVCPGTSEFYTMVLPIPGDTYLWSIINYGSNATITSPSVTGTSVTVNTGTTAGYFELTLRVQNAAEGYVLTRTCTERVDLDLTPPVITCPENQSLNGCGVGVLDPPYSATPAAISYADFVALGGTASDNCPNLTLSYQDTKVGTCTLTVTRTFTVTDQIGLSASCTQTIVIIDNETPVLSPAQDGQSECDGSSPELNPDYLAWLANHGGATATNECSELLQWSYTEGSWTNTACESSIPVTFFATDACGLISTGTTATFTIEDTTPPAIVNPAEDGESECQGPDPDDNTDYIAWLAAHANATASEICSTVDHWTYDAGNWSGGCVNTIDVTFYAWDECGNQSLGTTATFTIEDTTPPAITGQAQNETVECDGAGNTSEYTAWLTAHAGATASDVCGSQISWSYVEGTWSDECGNSKRITVTFYATDACDNKSVGTSAVFYIEDTTPPDITGQAQNETVECDGAGNTAQYAAWLLAHAGATAADVCGGLITWSYIEGTWSDECGNSTRITVTFYATDACGNKSVGTSAVFYIRDTTPPAITGQAQNETVECDGAGNTAEYAAWLAAHADATAADVCGGPITWSYVQGTWSDECGNSTRITVTFYATDDCNNKSVGTSAVFYIEDTTPPDITGQAQDETVECDGAGNTAEYEAWLAAHASATAADVCGGPITWSYDEGTWSDECGNSTRITVTFYATDDCDNTSVGTSAVFYIEDTTPPDITGQAQDETVECDGAGNIAEYEAWLDAHAGATASDVCGGPITWSYDEGIWSDECGNSTRITVTFYATDDCDNTSVGTSAVFYIEDTTPPDITGQAQDETVECDGAGNIAEYAAWLNAHAGATASDVCGGPITWSYVEGSWSDECGNSTRITVTFYATDDCDNTSVGTSAVFYIEDTTPPDITGQAQDETVECDGAGNTAEYTAWIAAHGSATASDVCGGLITWSITEGDWVVDCGNAKHRSVTFYAWDECGNQSLGTTATFTIEDTQDPVLDNLPPSYIEALCGEPVLITPPTASDGCDPDPTIICLRSDAEPCSNTIYPQGTTTVTFQAIDDCGNTSSLYTVTVFVQSGIQCADLTYEINDGNPLFCHMVGNTLTVTIPAEFEPVQDITWSVSGDWELTLTSNVHTVNFNVMNDDNATFTLNIIDVNGCLKTCTTNIQCEPADSYCTYTQGYWGNPGGSACNGLTTQENLEELLTAGIYLGVPGKSYTIAADSVDCVLELLPSGGPSLPFAADYACRYMIYNTLFGQTLALRLNLLYNPLLSGYVFTSPTIIAAYNSAGCGSYPTAQYLSKTISQSVYDYLEAGCGGYGMTINGLYSLANDALGDNLPACSVPTPPLEHITYSLDMVNKVFDECKWSYQSIGDIMSKPLSQDKGNNGLTNDEALNIRVNIVPNPFVSSTAIQFSVNQDVSNMTIEVLNAMGLKVTSLFQGSMSAGHSNTVTFTADQTTSQGVYFLVIRTDNESIVKRMIMVR